MLSDLLTRLRHIEAMIRGFPSAWRTRAPLVAQLAAAVGGLLVMAFAPPAQGSMLLVPMTEQARISLPGLAVGHGALLLGVGPLDGSLLVRGDRSQLGLTLLRQGIVPMAAPAILCGKLTGRGAEA